MQEGADSTRHDWGQLAGWEGKQAGNASGVVIITGRLPHHGPPRHRATTRVAPTMDEPGKALRRHSRGDGLSSPWDGVVALLASYSLTNLFTLPPSINSFSSSEILRRCTRRTLSAGQP